ncbi:MAG: ATP-binding protein [Thermodesulfobacteriota bacterium]
MSQIQTCGQNSNLLEEILSGLRQAIILTDTDGRVFFASRMVETLLGYKSEEISGRELALIFTPEDLTYLYPNLLFLCRQSQPFEGEVMLQRRNGTRFFAYLLVQPCLEPEAGRTVVAICLEDIDKQKQFEQMMRETHFEDLIKVANGIAHEIRNPLVGIGGFAGRLYRLSQASPEREQYYRFIVDNLRRIESLVRKVDFLVSLPKPTFRSESVRLLVEQALKPFGPLFEARALDHTVDLEDAEVNLDRDLVVRVIAILLENALDAMKDGGLIRIKGRRSGTGYELRVSDTGPGIKGEDLPFIFTPFFSTKPTGAGIDLAVVRRIMAGHGGRIEAESQPGLGATFILDFPLERRRAIRVSSLEGQPPPPAG